MEDIIQRGIFKKKDLEIIQKLKKNFLRIGVYILIGGVILGAILILVGGTEAGEYLGKAMGMFLIFALMMLVSANSFKRLESDRKSVQVMALMGLVMNFVWGILWTLAVWQVFDVMAYKTCFSSSFYSSYSYQCIDGYSVMGKIAMVASYLSVLGFFGSNIMAVKEYDRKNAILPLKITALVCLIYCALYAIITVLILDSDNSNDLLNSKMMILAGFAGVVWVVTWIIAAVLAHGAKKKVDVKTKMANGDTMVQVDSVKMVENVEVQGGGMRASEESEAEMRARIEEKVRREMEIEKEMREKLEKENS
ncbi:hypothetical protein IKG05_01810 [Candidatus Saccharibacteria bacterium]|nr:hypothetical protein [Candidatus Saccharibacteria bacterium]